MLYVVPWYLCSFSRTASLKWFSRRKPLALTGRVDDHPSSHRKLSNVRQDQQQA